MAKIHRFFGSRVDGTDPDHDQTSCEWCSCTFIHIASSSFASDLQRIQVALVLARNWSQK